MGLAHSDRFRGSAAFFALLLAASGARSDQASDAPPDAQASSRTRLAASPSRVGQAIVAVSKFSRRRPPFAVQ